MSATEELTNTFLNNTKGITSLQLFLIVIILTIDFSSLYQYGFDLKYYKYIINYEELLIINMTIILIFALFSSISKKIPYFSFLIFVGLITILHFNYYTEETGFFSKLLESVSTGLLYGLFFNIILNGYRDLYKAIIELGEFHKKIFALIAIIISFIIAWVLYLHYTNQNIHWETAYLDKNNKVILKQESSIKDILKTKIFNTKRLENIQDDIQIVNSKLYIEILYSYDILNNKNQIKLDNKIFMKYIDNNQYKTFFILKKEPSNNKYAKLFILLTKKDRNKEEYQISEVLIKKLPIYNN